MRQVVVVGIGVVGFAFGLGAGMMLSKRNSPPPETAQATAAETARVPADPAPTPALPPAPAAVAKISSTPSPGCWYSIGAKDTMADIARKAYGGTRRVPDLRAANPSLDPQRLKPGTLLYVPIAAEPPPPPPKSPPASKNAAPAPR